MILFIQSVVFISFDECGAGCLCSCGRPAVTHVRSEYSNDGAGASVVLQRASADAQHRVVGEAEDFSRAALRLHGGGSEGPRRDRARGVRLSQQDGPQTHGSDHGRQGNDHFLFPLNKLGSSAGTCFYCCVIINTRNGLNAPEVRLINRIHKKKKKKTPSV